MSEDFPGLDPSIVAGNAVLPQVEQLHAAMAEVVPLLEGNDAEAAPAAAQYVGRRAQELSVSDSGRLLGKDSGGTTTFIGPDTPLSMATMGNAYHMDDPSAYQEAFPVIQSTYTHLQAKMSQDKAYLNAVLAGVNYGQAAYFQSYFGNGKKRLLASFDILDEDEVSQGATSVADYKGTALCLERAAVAHNTAHIYGVASKLHAGNLTETAENGEVINDDDHAFLTVPNTTGDEYIFDPTNPITAWNEDGTVAYTRPAVYKRTPGAASQEVELKEFKLVNGQPELTNTHKLTYTFDATLA